MGKTYAVSDLHGRYDLWEQVKNFLQPEDTLYVIGDCADRGPDGFEIIKEVYEDPRCVYIKGNHEDLFVQAMQGDRALHDCNGGRKTYEIWRYNYGMDKSWIKKLDELPVRAIYVNAQGQTVDITHAGYTPGHYHNPNIDDRDNIPDDYQLVWDRDHLDDQWEEGFDDVIVIHGHTPIPYMDHYLGPWTCQRWGIEPPSHVKGAYWYCKSETDQKCHKVDIDHGAFFTGICVLMDLDTWEETVFTSPGEDD